LTSSFTTPSTRRFGTSPVTAWIEVYLVVCPVVHVVVRAGHKKFFIVILKV